MALKQIKKASSVAGGIHLAALLALFLVGCMPVKTLPTTEKPERASQYTPEEKSRLHREALKKYDLLTIEERIGPDGKEVYPFDLIPDCRETYLKGINTISEEHFFDNVGGHAHLYERTICLAEGYSEKILNHELGHIHHFGLDAAGYGFTEKWGEFVGSMYGKVKTKEMVKGDGENQKKWANWVWEDGSNGPRDGFICPYGAFKPPSDTYKAQEDVATFLEPIGYDKTPEDFLAKIKNSPSRKEQIREECMVYYPWYVADKEDPRYLKKLLLLHRHDFITDEEFRVMKSSLGALRDILEN